jgi:hypothetical protein
MFIFIACKKDKTEPANMGYNYIPLKQGSWIEYNVTEINIDTLVNLYDTLNYKLREVVHSTFYDNANRLTYRIERYWRPSDNDPWVIKDVWTANKSNSRYEKTEENIKFIRLAFAVKPEHKWDGNQFNTLGEQIYKYTDIDIPKTINNLYFDSTVVVEHSKKLNLIQYENKYEIYAAGIGLVKKHDVSLEINNFDTTQIKRGTLYFQTIYAYGQN